MYVRLAIYAGLALLLFATGWQVSDWRNDSQDFAIQQAAEKSGEAATVAAVAAIKSNRPVYTTINKALEREFHSEVRYTSPDCSHTPDSWRLLDQAYQAAGGEPFGGGTGVPATPTAAGRNTRGDDARPH